MQLPLGITCCILAVAGTCVAFYDNPEPVTPFSEGASLQDLKERWSVDWGFSGISTFAHLNHTKCLVAPDEALDIAVLGVPFDTATSYRPGLGPEQSARRHPDSLLSAVLITALGSTHSFLGPESSIVGDIPVNPVDNALALHQMTSGYLELLSRQPFTVGHPASHQHPKLITLGGDHSVALPALRALNRIYGKPISVLHFDAHLDTWHPGKYPSAWAGSPTQADFNHGSMFWIARNEGLIANSSSVHAGLRTRLSGHDYVDYEEDEKQGFLRIEADDIEVLGVDGIVREIMQRMGSENPVYLSIDIDVVDPGLAPGTGTPEVGGWTSREMIQILRGIDGLNLVGADVVEVAPAYDVTGESTALAAAQFVYEMMTSMVKRGQQERGEYVEVHRPGKVFSVGRDAKDPAVVGEILNDRKTEL